MTLDLAIVGGGVAAATALCTLKESRLKIGVIAPSNVSRNRIGEMLSPAANAILKQLGIWEDFIAEGHRQAHAVFSAWGSDHLIERNAMMSPQEPGWHLDRPRFDAFLWNCANNTEAKRFDTTLQGTEKQGSVWSLQLHDERKVRARFILDCSGRSAIVARHLSTRKRVDRLVAAYTFLNRANHDIEPTPATLIEALPNGWWYSALLPDNRMALAYFTDPDLLPRRINRDLTIWKALIEASKYTHERIETAGFEITGPPNLTDASTQYMQCTSGDDWCAAGDSAAAFDPLSSHGITTALWSGRKAALAIQAYLDGNQDSLKSYSDTMASGISRYLIERQSLYAMEKRYADYPFWQRR